MLPPFQAFDALLERGELVAEYAEFEERVGEHRSIDFNVFWDFEGEADVAAGEFEEGACPLDVELFAVWLDSAHGLSHPMIQRTSLSSWRR
jgi:hypothetical protein